MDRLHRHIRELIGDIKVGVADDTDFVGTDQFGVSGGKMVFLVDDTLFCLGDDSLAYLPLVNNDTGFTATDADVGIAALYLLMAGLGVVWLKWILAILAILVSAAGLATLYLHTNLTPPQQREADPSLQPGVSAGPHWEYEGCDWQELAELLLKMR